MSFPPPPNQRFAAPPPPPGATAPGRYPAPPGNAPTAFAAAPPNQQSFTAAPPAQQGMTQLNAAMGNMSMQQQRTQMPPPATPFPGSSAGPAPPAHVGAAPGMFRPGPPSGAGAPQAFFTPPAPQGQGAPPAMFQPPPAPGNAPAPPAGPAVFHPPHQPAAGQPGMMMMMPPPSAPGMSVPGMMQPTPPPPPPAAGGLASPAAPTFYHPQPTQGQMNRVAAPPAGVVPGAAPSAAQVNENIDYNVKIPERLFRLTAGMLPQSAGQAVACKIPLGALLRPLAPEGPDDAPVDTVQPGTAGIVRCKRCRTYINAFVTWTEHGRRWRCNICAQINDCPSAYFCHLDEKGLRRDRFERPELGKGVVEFIAPAEYMVRPPQEPSYFFVIDVSATAVRSGMLQCAARAIKASLDDLPGRGRTKVGFITFDNAVHYYNLASDLANPQMLVVSDLKELFVPLPDYLLVNLQESRKVVESFLDSLPEMFVKYPVVSQSCLGPALKAAFTVMKQIGGKMCVFQSIMPNLGDGALKPREQPGIMGTPNEIKLLRPDVTWYKDTAVEFSRQQICVDMFIFPYQYMDLASMGELPKYTSGTLHSYVSFSHERDGPRFEDQLRKTLTETTAFEAVMRIRCTKGMRITNFFGNFFIRGSDLLALPNCNAESVFGFDLAHEEQAVVGSHVTVQAALLYTSSDGERRIRVMTQALPVTFLTSEIIASVDVEACCALLAKQAIDVALKSSLDNARMRFQQICIEMLRAAKSGDKRTVSGYSAPPPGQHQGGGDSEHPVPENLHLLPLYTLALMKNVAFRGGNDVHPDERVQAHHLLSNMWVDATKHYIYPRLFSLHNMNDDAGYPLEGDIGDGSDDILTAGHNRIVLPSVESLSIDGLSSDGVYLLDNGVEMYLWCGRTADMNVIGSLFGVHELDDVDPNQMKVLTSGDPFASRFGAIVDALREDMDGGFHVSPKIHVIREGDIRMEARFYWFLIEDRASFQGGTQSYSEFMQFVNDPNASSGARAPPGPGAPVRGPPMPGQPPPPHQMRTPGPPAAPQQMGMPGPPAPAGLGMSGPPHASAGYGSQPAPSGLGMAPPHARAPQEAQPGSMPPPGPPISQFAQPMHSSGPPPYGAPPMQSSGPPQYGAPSMQSSGPPQYGAPPMQSSGPPQYGAPSVARPGPPVGVPPPPGRVVAAPAVTPPPAFAAPPTNPQQPPRAAIAPPPPRGHAPPPPPPPRR